MTIDEMADLVHGDPGLGACGLACTTVTGRYLCEKVAGHRGLHRTRGWRWSGAPGEDDDARARMRSEQDVIDWSSAEPLEMAAHVAALFGGWGA